jgi:centrin-3
MTKLSLLQNVRKKRREVTTQQLQEVNEAFQLLDSDKDSKIDYYELKVALKALGFDVKKDEILRLFRSYDPQDTGHISRDDFIEISRDMILKRDPMDELENAFKLFDRDDQGGISVASLRRVARELDLSPSEDDLRAMIDEFDTDGDGMVSLEDFVQIMTGEALLN